MKTLKQKNENDGQVVSNFHFIIERIHIKVKFSCRLYLQYFISQPHKLTKEIRVDPKDTIYRVDEEINQIGSCDNLAMSCRKGKQLNIHIKLLSSKGLAFTAGIISINHHDFPHFAHTFTLKFNKSQDFDAYCQCRRLDKLPSINQHKMDEYENLLIFSNKVKISSFQLQPEALKIQFSPQFKSPKNEKHKQIQKSTNFESSIKKTRKIQYTQQWKNYEKQLFQKIDYLQSELHKNYVLFDKQKEIIFLLQSKQKESQEQKNQLKNQIKCFEIEIEQKRQRIRQLQGEKLKLLMNSLQSQKYLTTLKENIASEVNKAYEHIKRLFFDKNMKFLNEYADKSLENYKYKQSLKNEFSNIGNNGKYLNIRGQAQQNSKVSFSGVRGLINKQVQHYQLQESIAFRDINPSEVLSNTFNDMSISDINSKTKEVSLLNSDLFAKPVESELMKSSSPNGKQFIKDISKNMSKIEKLVSLNIKKMIESFIEALERNKKEVKDTSSVEESLLNYLEQLENGFENQLGMLHNKQRTMVHYQQLIQQLNQTLFEKQNLVVQLQEQLFKLQEEKDHIKCELHDINYVHALKQEEYLKKIHILEHGMTMPDYSPSVSPTKMKQNCRKRQVKTYYGYYQKEIIQCKEHLKMMQIELFHQRQEKAKLMHQLHSRQLQLQQTLNEKRRLQFSIKLREKMNSLNQSIELSVQYDDEAEEQDYEKLTRQSLDNQQHQTNIIICQQ